MPSHTILQPRLSAYPWSLYQAEHLAPLVSRATREGFYGHMLRDDLRKQRYAYEVAFVPDDLDSQRASELLFALLNDFNNTGYARDPAALICDFVDVLLDESSGGKALLLELHSLPGERNRANRRAIHPESTAKMGASLPSLGLIPNWSAKETRSELSQTSPADKQGSIAIPGERVYRLRLRQQNRDTWKRVVQGLRRVDESKMVDAGVERLSWEGFSFSEAVAAQNLAVATSTAEIGWDGRGTFAEIVTSPYLAFRRLRFVRFWIDAIQDSVSFLNEFTTSGSLYGDETFSFSLTGLPNSADLSRAMDNIRNGSLTIEDAHNTYLFPKYTKRKFDSEIAP